MSGLPATTLERHRRPPSSPALALDLNLA